MLKEISVKKTELTIKDVVTTVLVGMGACAATMLVKKFFSPRRSACPSSRTSYLSVKSDNLWEGASHRVPALQAEGTAAASECSGGNGAVRVLRRNDGGSDSRGS